MADPTNPICLPGPISLSLPPRYRPTDAISHCDLPSPPPTRTPQISETLTKLFLYLDERQYEMLPQQVFSQSMLVMDNGEGPKLTSGMQIVEGWRANLEGVDAVYHQMNPYMITFTVRLGAVVLGWCLSWLFPVPRSHQRAL